MARESTHQCEAVSLGNYNCLKYDFEFDASDIFHIRPFEDMARDTRLQEVVRFDELFGRSWHDPIRKSWEVVHLETVQKDLRRVYDRVCAEYGVACELLERDFWTGAVSEKQGGERVRTEDSSKTTTTGGSSPNMATLHQKRVRIFDPQAGFHEDYTSDFSGDTRWNFTKDILPRYDIRVEFPRVYPTFNKRPEGSNACDFDPKTLQFSADCLTTWEDLWSDPTVVDLVRTHYGFDFEFFGYSLDPMQVMPL